MGTPNWVREIKNFLYPGSRPSEIFRGRSLGEREGTEGSAVDALKPNREKLKSPTTLGKESRT